MRVVGPSSEEEMILAFLKVEFYSPRFKVPVRQLLGNEANLVHRPRLDDPAENERRKQILSAYRGFGRDQYLFPGFPVQVEWTRLAGDRR